jgi:SAM-dependent methyltransferase
VTALPPKVYDFAQVLLGVRATVERLSPHLARLGGGSVLDVGGGTALYSRYLPPSADYLCLDSDLAKLRRARQVASVSKVLLCDATRMAIQSDSVDCALCVGVAHHLADDDFRMMLREIARVARRLIFLDPVAQTGASVGRLLWMLDAGSYPRSEATLREALSSDFLCEHIESYAVYHRYLMCVASPRRR